MAAAVAAAGVARAASWASTEAFTSENVAPVAVRDPPGTAGVKMNVAEMGADIPKA